MTAPRRHVTVAGGLTPYAAGSTFLTLYDSPTAMANHLEAEQHDGRLTEYRRTRASAWSGRPWSAALTALRVGDTSYVPSADALLEHVERALPWETRRTETVRAWDGPRLHTGAYLTGEPRPTLKRRKAASPDAPLIIVASVNCQGDVAAADIERRGAALFALARVMSARRPVQLWAGAFGATRGKSNLGYLTQIDTSPLSLAHAGYFLCDPSSARTLSFAARNLAHPTLSEHDFPPIGGSNTAAAKATGPIALAALGLTDKADVIFSPRLAGTFADPVAWVVEQVRKHSPGHVDD